jgi:hypothetical protein
MVFSLKAGLFVGVCVRHAGKFQAENGDRILTRAVIAIASMPFTRNGVDKRREGRSEEEQGRMPSCTFVPLVVQDFSSQMRAAT